MAAEQLPTIYRAADAAPMTWGDAMRAWEPIAQEALGACAAGGTVTTETDLVALVQDGSGIRTSVPPREWLGRLLTKVDKTVASNTPDDQIALTLSKYCVPALGAIRAPRTPKPTPDKVKARISTAPSPAPARERVPRAPKAQKKVEPPEPVFCASCFTQLPSSGSCDFCGY